MRKFTIVGLTGQTGAGKTTVSEFFSNTGFEIINADLIAREAMEKGSSCLKQVCAAFGEDILNSDGTLNRKVLAQKAFSSKDNTKMLNEITHPWITLRVMQLCREHIDHGKTLILYDAPLLFESCGDIMCDFTVCVTAPEKIRLERLMRRDGLSSEKIMERMKAQHDEDYYKERADHIIDGSRSLSEIEETVRMICRKRSVNCG